MRTHQKVLDNEVVENEEMQMGVLVNDDEHRPDAKRKCNEDNVKGTSEIKIKCYEADEIDENALRKKVIEQTKQNKDKITLTK